MKTQKTNFPCWLYLYTFWSHIMFHCCRAVKEEQSNWFDWLKRNKLAFSPVKGASSACFFLLRDYVQEQFLFVSSSFDRGSTFASTMLPQFSHLQIILHQTLIIVVGFKSLTFQPPLHCLMAEILHYWCFQTLTVCQDTAKLSSQGWQCLLQLIKKSLC